MVQLSQKTPVLAYAYIHPQNEAVIEKVEAECGFGVKRMVVNNEDPVKDILSQLPRVYAVNSIDCFCYIGRWVDEIEINGKWYAIYNIPPWTDTYKYIALPVWLAEEIKEQAPWLPMQNTAIGYRLDERITVVLGHVAIILYSDIPLQKAVELKSQAPWLKVRIISQTKIYNVKDTGAQEAPLCVA